jgi:DNA-binding transcriptional LysR family regulator
MRLPDFELSDLRVLAAVVDTGGVTRAAEALHCVQSAVTRRIKELESELNIALFVREHRKLVLTSAGRDFLTHARRILELADQAARVTQDDRPRGLLRIGSLESSAATRLPSILSEFHALHPEVEIQLITNTARGLADAIESMLVDCAFMVLPKEPHALEVTPLFVEELMIVTDRSISRVRTPSDIAHKTLITFPRGCAFRSYVERWFADHDLKPRRCVETSSYHAMLACVAAGMGIALAPKSLIQTYAHPHAIQTFPMAKAYAHTTIALARRRDVNSRAVQALWAVAQRASEKARTHRKAAASRSDVVTFNPIAV